MPCWHQFLAVVQRLRVFPRVMINPRWYIGNLCIGNVPVPTIFTRTSQENALLEKSIMLLQSVRLSTPTWESTLLYQLATAERLGPVSIRPRRGIAQWVGASFTRCGVVTRAHATRGAALLQQPSREFDSSSSEFQ